MPAAIGFTAIAFGIARHIPALTSTHGAEEEPTVIALPSELNERTRSSFTDGMQRPIRTHRSSSAPTESDPVFGIRAPAACPAGRLPSTPPERHYHSRRRRVASLAGG